MKFFKFFLPGFLIKLLRPIYHSAVARVGGVWFGHPSEKLVVIGVTGTNGKSTTVNLIVQILEEAGFRTGFTSTVNFNINGKEQLNNLKMTMPSGWVLQKWMSEMVHGGFKYVVLEISSEGLAQGRHKDINFDVTVFTNLTPEHIESHGGFENYKAAKGLLFAALEKLQITNTKLQINQKLQKTIIVNSDDEYAEYFKSFKAERYISYGLNNKPDLKATDPKYSPNGISFNLESVQFNLHLKGKFDVYNALAAIAVGVSQGISFEKSRKAIEKISVIPGRMEVVQEKPFSVLVDYAPEPYSLKALYETIETWPKHRLIHVLGSTGGGRDKARRKLLGKMAGETADIVIVTNEDPYDDDPKEIIHEVADGAVLAGKIIGQNLFRNPDRRGAFAKAFSLAVEGDLVLITGKGSEQKMAVANGKYIDWDDRKIAREELGYKALHANKI